MIIKVRCAWCKKYLKDKHVGQDFVEPDIDKENFSDTICDECLKKYFDMQLILAKDLED